MLNLLRLLILTLFLTPGCTRENTTFLEIGKLIRPMGSYSVGLNPTSIAAADFDLDGATDLIITNISGNSLSYLAGNGDGTFQDTRTIKVGEFPRKAVTSDFNGDQKPDIALGLASSKQVLIMLGQGDGTFTPGEIYPTQRAPLDLVLHDFDGDQKLDLAVAHKADQVDILLSQGDGTFHKADSLVVQDTPTSIAIADYNRDTIPDLAVSNNGAMSNNVSVFLGRGDGTFQPSGNFPTSMRPLFVAAGDFTGEGDVDLVVINGIKDSLSFLSGQGDGTFKNAVHFGAGAGPAFCLVLDVNKDERLDILVANNIASSIALMLGKGDGTFHYPPINYLTERGPFAITPFQFSKDGENGLAVANNGKHMISIFALETPFNAVRIPSS